MNNLSARRQNVTTTYLSVNAALVGAMAFLFKDGQLSNLSAQISSLMLLSSGIIACGLWRRLVVQYSTQIDWWYKQLRELESKIPHSKKLITKEFSELYQQQNRGKKFTGMTRHEKRLTWLFTVVYIVFGISIVIYLSLHFL